MGLGIYFLLPQNGTGAFTEATNVGLTTATTTINTTSTQVASAISGVSGFLTIENNTTSTLTCIADAAGTTAASSTATTSLGFIIGPSFATSTGQTSSSTVVKSQGFPSEITFGQCWEGSYRCIPHTGAVNCIADAKVTNVTKITR